MPKTDSKEFTINVKMAEGTSLERTSTAIGSVEKMIKELLGDDVESVYSKIGPSTGTTISSTAVYEGENTAQIKVILKPNGKYVASQVTAAIAKWYAEYPQFQVTFTQDETALQSILGTQDAPVVVEVRGTDLTELKKITKQVEASVKDIPGFIQYSDQIWRGATPRSMCRLTVSGQVRIAWLLQIL